MCLWVLAISCANAIAYGDICAFMQWNHILYGDGHDTRKIDNPYLSAFRMNRKPFLEALSMPHPTIRKKLFLNSACVVALSPR